MNLNPEQKRAVSSLLDAIEARAARLGKERSDVLKDVIAEASRRGMLKELGVEGVAADDPDLVVKVAAAVEAEEEVERRKVQDYAWSLMPKAWAVRKRMACNKYVYKALRNLGLAQLKTLSGSDLRALIRDVGTGYDVYMARRAAQALKDVSRGAGTR